VVGGDIDSELLGEARDHYGTRFPLARFDAQALPFRDAAFDLVLFFEASYYVADMSLALDEIARVVASGGTVTFVNANPERPDFIRSPHSHKYHTADEFRAELGARGFDVTVEGTYPVERGGAADKVVVLARKVLERLGLTPSTLRARAMVKRLIYGKLDVLPAELGPDSGTPAARTPHAGGPLRGYKVMYVTARRPTAPA
jgi:SAM-dependent methyltransferase